MTDIQIAQQAAPLPIGDIAAACGIDPQYLEQYGRYKAKIDYRLLRDRADRPDGKLILVTAITPTPAGEGKTSTSTSPGISTPSGRPTTCWPLCWTTTSSRATPWASTASRSCGSAAWT